MANPMKRICREAVRYVSQCQTQASQCQRRREAQCIRRTATHQRRPYSNTSRTRAALRQNDANELQDEDYEAEQDILDMEEAVPEALMNASDLSSTGYSELEQHRELRQLVRTAAWEMPLLSSLAKPFTPPDPSAVPLRWRYTTYFGESHPASRKVVVEFNVFDLKNMNEAQQLKLKKLCGARYNPEKNVVKMSCESFETQAQNKRYLGDIIQKLIAESTDPNADSFEDIPLDVRHHKFKKVLKRPEEWNLTPERRQMLDEKRQNLMLEEGKRVEENAVISGIAAIEAARQVRLQQVEEPVMAEARQTLPRGKMGRKEMGQTGGAGRY